MRQRKVREHRINHEIKSANVRLVPSGDEDEGEEGVNEVIPTSKALQKALHADKDLVMISDKADPPVVKIMNYAKFAYDLKKQRKAQKSKQSQVTLKEIRLGPNTDDHDLGFKMKHAEKFLEDGNKLKVFVQFRGRNIIYKDRGRDILERVVERLEDHGKVEMEPRMEGRRMILIMSPQ
jgi:translation initiation factor IF-3